MVPTTMDFLGIQMTSSLVDKENPNTIIMMARIMKTYAKKSKVANDLHFAQPSMQKESQPLVTLERKYPSLVHNCPFSLVSELFKLNISVPLTELIHFSEHKQVINIFFSLRDSMIAS